jgi:hypothetical protein
VPAIAHRARRHPVGRTLRAAAAVAVATAGVGAHAQQVIPETAPRIEVTGTAYLWFPWSHVHVRPSDSRVPNASETIDPGRLYNQLTWVPFMGEAEFRSGAYGVVVDYIHAPVKGSLGTRNILFNGGSGGLEIDTGTLLVTYRALADAAQHADLGLGVRAWGFDASLSLAHGLLPPANVSGGRSWADPLLAARYRRDFGGGWSGTANADIGGFGVGAHLDWQVLATVDRAVYSWLDLRGGFRSLGFNHGGDRSDLAMHMYGPLLAATVRF